MYLDECYSTAISANALSIQSTVFSPRCNITLGMMMIPRLGELKEAVSLYGTLRHP